MRIAPSPPHLLAEAAKLLKIPRHASRADHGPFALGNHQQTFGSQFLKCLPDRHLADPEGLGNFALRTECLPLAQLLFLDQLAHMIHNLHVVGHEAVVVDRQAELLYGDQISLRQSTLRTNQYT